MIRDKIIHDLTDEILRTYGFFFVLGIIAALTFVIIVFHYGLRRTISSNIAFWQLAGITALTAIAWPSAVVALLIELLFWGFILNPYERDSDPMWKNVLAFIFCAGLLLVVVVWGR